MPQGNSVASQLTHAVRTSLGSCSLPVGGAIPFFNPSPSKIKWVKR